MRNREAQGRHTIGAALQKLFTTRTYEIMEEISVNVLLTPTRKTLQLVDANALIINKLNPGAPDRRPTQQQRRLIVEHNRPASSLNVSVRDA